MMRGDGRVYKRGSRWWLQFMALGKKRREPAQVLGEDGLERPARDEREARRALKARRAEVLGRRYVANAEKVTVGELLDDYVVHQENSGLRSVRTLRVHLDPVRSAFGAWKVVHLTTAAFETYQRDRRDLGRAPATVNRELEALRGALRYAARQTPPKFPEHLLPTVPMLRVENTRTGYFTVAEVEALTAQVEDPDIVDFIEWAFRTAMRRGEISRLEWPMLDTGSDTWVLRIPGTITKNARGRSFGFDGEAREIMERRLQARRLDTTLIFHRAGRPMGPFRDLWRSALKAAGLPAGRLFHDLRRSGVRNLIRSGVDQATAMKVSGHVTTSMFTRYNITTEGETAEALKRADAYLATQPRRRNVAVAAGAFGGAHPGHRTSRKSAWGLVPEVGLEPTLAEANTALNRARLPIPPLRQRSDSRW
jgi:integrase